MSIRTLIVDDEPPARKKIKLFLEADESLEMVGEASNGMEALLQIEQQKPDLVFLDIQMPQMTGLEVIEHLSKETMPCLIFTTAYDQYTLKAFEVHAVDYLLKPFDRQRFELALNRAKERLQQQNVDHSQLLNLIHSLHPKPEFLKRFLIKSQERLFFINAEEIDWLEASHKYIVLHKGEEEHLLRDTLSHLEEQLDPNVFVRIHRSYMVRLDFIQEIQSLGMGEYTVLLKNQVMLNLGKKYKARLLD